MPDIARFRRSCVAMRRPSIPADGVYDPIALGKDLEALIAALSDDGQARVVGMDWGGTSTLQALATAPAAIKAAVVMNTAHPITFFQASGRIPKPVRSHHHFYYFQMPGADTRSISRGSLRRLSLEAVVDRHSGTTRHLSSIKATLSSPGTMNAALKYYAGLFNSGGRLPMNAMHTPTLTIYGQHDDRPPRYSVEGRTALQGAAQAYRACPTSDTSRTSAEAEVTGLINGLGSRRMRLTERIWRCWNIWVA